MRQATEADKAWAEDLARQRPKRVVIHGPTNVIGKVEGFRVLEPEESGRLPNVVLTIGEGHELHALKENFLVLSEGEVRLWEAATESFATVLKELAVWASSVEKISRPAYTRIVSSVVEAQKRALHLSNAAELAKK